MKTINHKTMKIVAFFARIFQISVHSILDSVKINIHSDLYIFDKKY